MFYILTDYYKQYKERKCTFKLSIEMKERVQDYLEESDKIYSWFREHYEPCENSIITMKYAHNLYKITTKDLTTKKQRRKQTQKWFKKEVKNNFILGKFCPYKNLEKVDLRHYTGLVDGQQKTDERIRVAYIKDWKSKNSHASLNTGECYTGDDDDEGINCQCN